METETYLDNIFSLETCPICLDDIELCAYNYVKTDCKHCFHASCFMMHTAHNGYTCPCCRNQLIESSTESEDDEDDSDNQTNIINEHLHDLSLLAFRNLIARVETQDNDDNEESVWSDNSFESEIFQRGHEYNGQENTPNISISELSSIFQDRGLSYEDLVALCVLPHKDNLDDVRKYSASWIINTEREIGNILQG